MPESKKKRSIKQTIPLFDNISEFDDNQFEKICQIFHAKSGETVLKKNDVSSDVFLILNGTVSVCDYSIDGKEVTYLEISEGGIFGEFAAIDGGPRSASIEAKTEALIARMCGQDFRALIASNGIFGLRVAEHLVTKTRALSQRIFEFSALSVRHRLYAEILRLCEVKSNREGICELSPAPSHYELATRIATHREAVTKELNRLVAIGLAKLERRSITIKDVSKLRRMVAENDGS